MYLPVCQALHGNRGPSVSFLSTPTFRQEAPLLSLSCPVIGILVSVSIQPRLCCYSMQHRPTNQILSLKEAGCNGKLNYKVTLPSNIMIPVLDSFFFLLWAFVCILCKEIVMTFYFRIFFLS